MALQILPRSNLGLRLLSLGVAVALFLVVRGERQVSQRFTVPLEVHFSAGLAPLKPVPDHLAVSVNGPWARLRSLQGTDLGPVRIDLSGIGPGTAAWYVGAESLRLPAGVRVESIYPSQGAVELRSGLEQNSAKP